MLKEETVMLYGCLNYILNIAQGHHHFCKVQKCKHRNTSDKELLCPVRALPIEKMVLDLDVKEDDSSI